MIPVDSSNSPAIFISTTLNIVHQEAPMETQGMNRGSDELSWKLAGLRHERQQVEERLNYLREEERRLTGLGLTGPAKDAKVASAAKGGSKGVVAKPNKWTANLSPETRKKMADAARRRWDAQRQAKAQGQPTPEQETPATTEPAAQEPE